METNTDKVLELCRTALAGEGDLKTVLVQAHFTIEALLAQKAFLLRIAQESQANMEKRISACEASLRIRDRGLHADYWVLYPMRAKDESE